MKVESKVSIKHVLFLSILLLVLATQTSFGEIPKQISYQGMLTDEAGKPADGSYNITFRIYYEGEPLWSETQDVEVSKGVFNTILGSGNYPLNLPFDKPYLLGITVDGTELQPRIPLTASPYSLNVPSISGGDGSPWEIKNGNVCLLNGNVGIGTTNPFTQGKLHVSGSVPYRGIQVTESNYRPTIYITGEFPNLIIGSSGNASHGSTIGLWAWDKGTTTHQWNMGVGQNGLFSMGYATNDPNPHAGLNDLTMPSVLSMTKDGKVGIGITAPSHKLHVNGDIFATGKIIGAKEVEFKSVSGDFSVNGGLSVNSGATGSIASFLNTNANYSEIFVGGSVSNNGSLAVGFNQNSDFGYLGVWGDDLIGAGNGLIIKDGGNVGIGTTSPLKKLDVTSEENWVATFGKSGQDRVIVGTTYNGKAAIGGHNSALTAWTDLILNEGGSNVGIGTTEPQAKLDVNGATRTRVLEITGGADLSEQFEVKGTTDSSNEKSQIEAIPGMVVCIDTENPGELVVSKKAYDRTVAGIISGAGGVKPGMLMSQTGTIADGNHPVALTGRVYCLADDSNGTIQPGDLLTTSDTPGHAMKVTDYPKAQGAILGKAMSSLEEGRGLILVLVTLQ